MNKNTIRSYKDSGIYKIINLKTNKLYIGSSINIYRRYHEHKRGLNAGTHINKHLQYAFNKYGKESFKFRYIELGVKSDQLNNRERYYILKYNTLNGDFGYNSVLPEDDNNRREHSDETKYFLQRQALVLSGIITDAQYNQWKLDKELKKWGPHIYPQAYPSKVEIVVLNKITGTYIAKYESISEASRMLNISDKRISDVINGRINHHKGMTFVRSINYVSSKDYSINKTIKRKLKCPIVQSDINGCEINVWEYLPNMSELGMKLGTFRDAVTYRREYKGYYWTKKLQ